MSYMGNNVPRDYTGYEPTANMSYADKKAMSRATVLANAPCYDPAVDSEATATECYDTIVRLAYLNQQMDVGSLILRANNKCLTEDELNQITLTAGEDTAKNHPLNCAKINAKPFPYFDGGIMFMRRSGWFPFFSSRNNNFSNRQQSGVLCIGANCTVDSRTNVLQDVSPAFSGLTSIVRSSPAACVDTANSNNGANNNGAQSCIFANNASVAPNNILTVETFTRTEADNDSKGDGNMQGCGILSFSVDDLANSVEQQVVLAFVLLAVGILAAWLGFYVYNRYRAKRDAEPRFRSSTEWHGGSASTGSASMFSFGGAGDRDYEMVGGKKMPKGSSNII